MNLQIYCGNVPENTISQTKLNWSQMPYKEIFITDGFVPSGYFVFGKHDESSTR